jgi:hypothetical protein
MFGPHEVQQPETSEASRTIPLLRIIAILFLFLSTVLASAADWDIIESISKIDGAKRTAIIKRSTDHDASLIIRLNGNDLDVYMTFNSRFAYIEGHQQPVRVKFDGNPPRRQLWTEAASGDSIFSRSPIEFISALAHAKDFLIEVHPYGRLPETVAFQIEGLQPKLDASGIAQYITVRQKREREAALRRLRQKEAAEQETERRDKAEQEWFLKGKITKAQHEQMLKYCSGFEAYERPSNCPAN